MTWQLEFLLLVGGLVGLLFTGLWIPFAIGVCGLAFLYIDRGAGAFNALGLIAWGGMNNVTLTAVPLFILMAEIILQSGVSRRLYDGLAVLLSRLPGGLLQTNIIGCATFAAISGSSVATAASIGKVALPNLAAQNYRPAESCGSLAAGGTLGILIPPSVVMIIYGSVTETSIAKLFAAGMVPGIVLASLFCLYIGIRALLQQRNGKVATAVRPRGSIGRALLEIVPFGILIAAILGGLYTGLVTPTEAAGVGCTFALVIGRLWGGLTLRQLLAASRSAIRTSCSIMFIVLAAYIFSYATEMAGISRHVAEALTTLDLGKWQFLMVVLMIFVLLGCVMDTIAIMMLTLPLIVPLLVSYQIDLVWFGVIATILLELGQITPPFGINLFVIQSLSNESLGVVARGSVPYFFLMLLIVALICAFPQLALWLPSRL